MITDGAENKVLIRWWIQTEGWFVAEDQAEDLTGEKKPRKPVKCSYWQEWKERCRRRRWEPQCRLVWRETVMQSWFRVLGFSFGGRRSPDMVWSVRSELARMGSWRKRRWGRGTGSLLRWLLKLRGSDAGVWLAVALWVVALKKEKLKGDVNVQCSWGKKNTQ